MGGVSFEGGRYRWQFKAQRCISLFPKICKQSVFGQGLAVQTDVPAHIAITAQGMRAVHEDAIHHLNIRWQQSKFLSHMRYKQSPRLAASVSHRRARVLNRQAARGHSFVRAEGSAGGQSLNGLHRYAQLMSRNLHQSMQDALANLHFARHHLNPPIGQEGQPLRQAAVGLQAAR